jgi:hypothetical protein
MLVRQHVFEEDEIEDYDEYEWDDKPASFETEDDEDDEVDDKLDEFDPEQIDFLDFQSPLVEDQDFLDDILTFFPENAHIDDHTVFLEGILGGGEQYLWALDALRRI